MKVVVANRSIIWGQKLFNFSFVIFSKIFPDVIHYTGNSLTNIQRPFQNLPQI